MHTHTQSHEGKRTAKRQRRGKTTTHRAAGGDATVSIFDDWATCCTHTQRTLLILMEGL